MLSAKQAFIGIEKNKGHIDLGKIGVASASTFPGFCNLHDTALFKPVELPRVAAEPFECVSSFVPGGRKFLLQAELVEWSVGNSFDTPT